MKWFHYGFLVAVLFPLPSSEAGDRYSVDVQSSHSGRKPYAVVFESERAGSGAPSEAEPGLYAIDRKGDSETPIVLGTVLGASRGFNGIQGVFSGLTATTGQDEMLVVVDGRLVLFANYSSRSKPGSILAIGSEMTPARDVLSGQEVHIDPIGSLDDLSVLIPPVDGTYDGQLALISIRQPNMFGNGITIALNLLSTRNGIQLARGQASIIDYQFHPTNILGRLALRGVNGQIISPLLVYNLARPREADPPLLLDWQEKVRVALRQVLSAPDSGTAQANNLIHTAQALLPTFVVPNGSAAIKVIPSEAITAEEFPNVTLTQTIDPVTCASHVIFLTNGFYRWGGTASTLGVIERRSTKGTSFPWDPYLVRFHSNSEGGPAALAIIDKKLHVFFGLTDASDRKIVTLNLNQSYTQFPDQLSFTHFSVGLEHFFIVSIKMGETGLTSFYRVKEMGGGVILNASRRILKTYLDQKELEARVKLGPQLGTSAFALGFDNLTPVRGIAKYRPNTRMPYLNLMGSNEDGSQVYFEALENTELVLRGLSYRRFDPKGATTQQSGLYVLADPGRPPNEPEIQHFQPGALVERPGILKVSGAESEDAKIDLSRIIYDEEFVRMETSSIPELNATVRLVAFPIAPVGIDTERKAFHILFYSQATNASMRSGFFTFEIQAELKQLVGIKLLPASNKVGEYTLLLFFRKKTARDKFTTRNPEGGVLAVPITLEEKSERVADFTGRLYLKTTSQTWIYREELSPDAVRSRLVRGRDERVYWMITPEKAADDGSFTILPIGRPDVTIRPNSPGERVALKLGEPIDLAVTSYSSGYSKWGLYTGGEVTRRFPTTKDAPQVLAAKDGPRAVFPDLEATLDALADVHAAKPGHVVLLVDAAFRESVRQAILGKLLGHTGRFSTANRDFYFYALDPTAGDNELREQLTILRRKDEPGRRNLLFVDAEELVKQNPGLASLLPDADTEEKSTNEVVDEDPEEAEGSQVVTKDDTRRYSPFMHLAGEGQFATPRAFKAREGSRDVIPELILSTAAEWSAFEEAYPAEQAAGVFSSFHVVSRFLTSPWTVWPPNSLQASKEVKAAAQVPISTDEEQVFPTLVRTLGQAADLSVKPTTRVILVSPELKELIRRMTLGRWASSSRIASGDWNHRNSELALFHLANGEAEATQGLHQEAVLDRLDTIRKVGREKRAVLLGALEDLVHIGRPVPEDEKRAGYKLRDPAATGGKSTLVVDAVGEPVGVESARHPHILWEIATEGRKLQPKAFQGESPDTARSFSTVLIGTHTEWEAIRTETGFEQRFGLLERFETVELEAPSTATKIALIDSVFGKLEIARLGYQFLVAGRTQEQARAQLVALFVNRVEQIARSQGQDPTTAFIRALGQLRYALVEDLELRQAKTIDSRWIERLFTSVFPIAINLANLPDTDPLRRIEDPARAAVQLQQIGYNGPLALKERVLRVILDQTRGSDDSRPIPASFVLFGGTSTGKTFLARKIIELLGLKLYDIDRPGDEKASALILNFANIVEEEDKAHPELITIAQAIDHISNFLSLPNGHRGFLVIDDLHKARSTKVLKEIMSFLHSLFEAKGGLFRVKRMGTQEVREIPIRSLTIVATVNPTVDEAISKRFGGDGAPPKRRLIAALTRPDYTIEESHFERWAAIINMDEFPVDAKVPSLEERVRRAAGSEYTSSGALKVVDSRALAGIVAAFPTANAREFLSAATNAVLGLGQNAGAAPLYLIVPMQGDETETVAKEAAVASEISALNAIETHVRATLVTRAIKPSDFRSELEFMAFTLGNFRLRVYEYLLQEAQSDSLVSGDFERRKQILGPIVFAIMSGIEEGRNIPPDELDMDGRAFGLTNDDDLDSFADAVRELSAPGEYFPINFESRALVDSMSLTDFLKGSTGTVYVKNRLDVMSETTSKIERALAPAVAAFYRIRDLTETDDLSHEDWISRMSGDDPKDQFRALGQKLVRLYFEFTRAIFNPDLMEMQRESAQMLTTYDQFRLFLLCIDKALTSIPWGRLSHYMVQAMAAAQGDLALGQRPEFTQFLFQSTLSPVRTVTPDFLLQNGQGARSEAGGSPSDDARAVEGFRKICEGLLTTRGGGRP